jgi:hypothetical protein
MTKPKALVLPKSSVASSNEAPSKDSMTTFGLLRSEPGSKKLTDEGVTSKTVADEATLMLPASSARSRETALAFHLFKFSMAVPEGMFMYLTHLFYFGRDAADSMASQLDIEVDESVVALYLEDRRQFDST